MYVIEVSFLIQNKMEDTEQILERINFLLGALRMNGQIVGHEFSVAYLQSCYRTYLLAPEQDSLDKSRANSYVLDGLNKLNSLNIECSWKVVGNEPYSSNVCGCKKSSYYILYTTYVSFESPLRCGDCFGIIPLYRIPATKDAEYVDILAWESDYKACDTLQMNCSTGERYGISQLSKYDSSLSKRGIDICNRITTSTGIPTYYYLMKVTGKSNKVELKRKCPSCNGEWFLHETLYGIFDFKCDKCRLLSNVGWSVHK
jgi:predicted  nucleic acid-binding Zn ribbon protein